MSIAPRPFRLSELSRRAPHAFALIPDAAQRAALAEVLGVSEIRKLRFDGRIEAEGKGDWRLEATLGATVVQPCVVTLAPVLTRIDTPVLRRYLKEFPEPEPGSETEMSVDETTEPLCACVDPAEVMAEALALALPDFPRVDGADFGAADFAPPGAAPLRDEDLKPFAALAKLTKTPEE